ncbi:sulfurtransferase TusA family protein [Numidum massiliense]|uniref:sulfurtransferase TusA family protein n=1 Tax=Numidum massiliense TaxID=1522315 RepID=UPI0006D592F2|nr:sulfurtransferase TusA family protein [Numidum massiliense]
MQLTVDKVLDATGLSCPMPIVKTKRAIDGMAAGEVLEVHATDQGSTADIKAWAKSTGVQYLGTITAGDVLKHYVRKPSVSEVEDRRESDAVVALDQLQEKVAAGEKLTIIDVREQAEYAFGHIPGAKNIPLGELEERLSEIDRNDDIYVICRSGNRSDLAVHTMKQAGLTKVKNVVPGMNTWTGPTETSHA